MLIYKSIVDRDREYTGKSTKLQIGGHYILSNKMRREDCHSIF